LQPPRVWLAENGRLQAAPTHDFVWQALDPYFFASASGKDAAIFGFGNGATKFLGSLNPRADHNFNICHHFSIRITVSRATGNSGTSAI